MEIQTGRQKCDQKGKAESLVLGELVSYIEEYLQDKSMPVFKLSDLESGLREQDAVFTGNVNNTRLKEMLLHFITDLQVQTQGRWLDSLLILNVPVNNFSVMLGRSHRFLGITSTSG